MRNTVAMVQAPRRWWVFSHLLAFVCGFCFLSLAILSKRVMAPHYGNTLYLATALSGVNLMALAAGFILGGRGADREWHPSRMRVPLLLAGVWLLVTGWLLPVMLAISTPLGLRLSVLIAATAVFAPPLAALGTVIPFLVGAPGRQGENPGRMAGRQLAVAALGCACGAVVCGYWLVPRVGIDLALKGLSLVLVTLAVLAGVVGSPSAALSLLFIPLYPALMWLLPEAPRNALPEGAILQEDTPYSLLSVAAHGDIRSLYLDGRLSGTVEVEHGRSFSVLQPVLTLPAAFHAVPGRVLIIGLADGSLAGAYARLGWTVEAVEEDPEVIRAAFEHFGLTPQDASVFQSDGRSYLRLGTQKFDVVILDAFPTGYIPFHLISREALLLARERLAADGMLLLHVPAPGLNDPALSALASTLGEIFPQVWVLPVSQAPGRPTRKVLLACRDLPEIISPAATDSFAQLVWSKRLEMHSRAPVVTDLRNPMDLYWEANHPAVREAGW